MSNRKTALAVLLTVSVLAGSGVAQTLEENWNDFLHYTKIGRFDLAKSFGQAILQGNPDPVKLLEISQANLAGYELALRASETSHDEELADVTAKILAVIDQGRFMRRSDPKVIVEEIRRLSSTPRGKVTAIKRLRDAGEYAVPFMLEAMADPARQTELSNIIEALPQIGRSAIRPLTAALQTTNANVKAEVVRALGEIRYPQSLAYLKYVAEQDGSAELRNLAAASIRQIDPSALNIPAAALFYRLGENYYYHAESLAPAEDADFGNVWFWDTDKQGLAREEVDKKIFNELMAMRCCEWTLKAEEQFGLGIGLWVAAFFKAEATGAAMPQYFGENHADALVYATTAGPEYLHQALARAIKDQNADVALGTVEALATTAGEKSLFQALGAVQPLLQALSFPDKAVRYSAAIAVANAGPAEPFAESNLVVRNLAEAIGQSARATTDPTPRWTAELADSYAQRAAESMLEVALSRNPRIDLAQAQPALITAVGDSRANIQLLAGQVLSFLDSPDAQRAIAAMALTETNSAEVRVGAFASLATAAKLHANMLPDAMINQIYGLLSDTQADPELRAAAAAAYGALNLPSQKVKDLILDQAKS